MGRKPVLGLAGALLTSLALAGCQNNPPSPQKPFRPDNAGISQNKQTNNNGTQLTNNGVPGAGAQRFNNTSTPLGGTPYQVPGDPRPVGPAAFGSPSPANQPNLGNGPGVPGGFGQPISNSNFNPAGMDRVGVPTYPNASPPALKGNSMGPNSYSTAPPGVPGPLVDRPPSPPPLNAPQFVN
jgi:hypothetical protein